MSGTINHFLLLGLMVDMAVDGFSLGQELDSPYQADTKGSWILMNRGSHVTPKNTLLYHRLVGEERRDSDMKVTRVL